MNSFPISINGQVNYIGVDEAFDTVAQYLRRRKGLTGTKIVCAEGDCGACSVLAYRKERDEFVSVDSCILFMFQLAYQSIVTVEGLPKDNPVACTMAESHGAQCGYCTPGIVMALYEYHHSKEFQKGPSKEGIQDALTGNLCRCTGYEPIVDAGLALKKPEPGTNLKHLYPLPVEGDSAWKARQSLLLKSNDLKTEVFLPKSFQEALVYKAKHPKVRIVQGATDFGVQINKGAPLPDHIMGLQLVDGLDEIKTKGERQFLGCLVTLRAWEDWAKDHCRELHQMLVRFAAPQIKNLGTVVGNIANGSPIGDTLPFFAVSGAEVHLESTDGQRTVPFTEFFKGYKTFDMRANELIVGIEFQLPQESDYLKLYKVSRRRHLDISTFTAAFWQSKDPQGNSQYRVAYGGVGPTVLRLKATEGLMARHGIQTPKQLEAAKKQAVQEITPIGDVRSTKDHRLTLAANIMEKFMREALEDGVL